MQSSNTQMPDVLIVGGGIVGMAIAYGVARSGLKPVVLDEGDQAFRASRGNFGLVWVQGKGAGQPHYTRLSRLSASLWPQLAAHLFEETGVDVQLRQPGGFHLCLSESDFAKRAVLLNRLRSASPDGYPFEMLDRTALRERLPAIGPEVAGASYSPMDGHVNPLKLLRALHEACARRGVRVVNAHRAEHIEHAGGVFTVRAGDAVWQTNKLVLAAGLGNRALTSQVGLNAPVSPIRGQVLIAERALPFLRHPTTFVRQTDEGTIQLGDSHEDVGLDDTTTTDTLSAIARNAIRSFPILERVRLVRAWGSLRVMSPDGLPIYQQSPTQPGAYVVTCHSGVTLAAAHVDRIAPWIAGGAPPADAEAFSGSRFLNSVAEAGHAH